MDAIVEIRRLYHETLRTLRIGGDALGTTSGGHDRAKGYVRALLDATVLILTERAGDGRPVSYALARAVLNDDLTVGEALRRHAEGLG